MVQIEGMPLVNGIRLNARDAMEIVEEGISIAAGETSHYFLIEMKKAS